MTTLRWFPDEESQAVAAADLVAERASRCVRERGRFLLALSGGRTPAPLYDRLAIRTDVPWRHTHVFWGDERCVPDGDPRSNAALARDRLLSRVPVPAGQVHAAPAQTGTPEQAARRWEAELRAFFGDTAPFPPFDLVILGLGRDGHTASLFSGHPALEERGRWAVAVEHAGSEPPVPRVTLTLPVLNAARCALFLAASDKEDVVRALHEAPGGGAELPAARVRPVGDLFWYAVGRGTPGSPQRTRDPAGGAR